MQFKLPKSDKYQWTQHSIYKMRQYGLSPQRVIRVVRNPERVEEGIVEKTIAVMQPASTRVVRSSTRGGPASKTWSQEIWVMYQIKNQKSKIKNQNDPHLTLSLSGRGGKGRVKIISAWRYPGVSPKNNPIPDEILREIKGIV